MTAANQPTQSGKCLDLWRFLVPETLTALFKTSLRTDFPFDTTEMVMYSIIG